MKASIGSRLVAVTGCAARGRGAVRVFALALAIVVAAAALSGCDRSPERAATPSPSEVLADAVGHYCGMLLADHDGPKGQIHLASRDRPVWFSSVRDTIAFLRLPEEAKDVTAVYVNDMARATNLNQPEAGAWVEARSAWFVIDSRIRGGMGAPEAIPFSSRDAAEAFRERHGGTLARLDEIPDAYVLGPVDLGASAPRHATTGATGESLANAAPTAAGVAPMPGDAQH